MKLFEKWWENNTKTFSIIWYPRHTLETRRHEPSSTVRAEFEDRRPSEGLGLTKDGKPFDSDNYFFQRIQDFFDSTEETVQKLIGRCFKSPFRGYMIKIIGIRSDRDNRYWNESKLWQEFIYKKQRRGILRYDKQRILGFRWKEAHHRNRR